MSEHLLNKFKSNKNKIYWLLAFLNFMIIISFFFLNHMADRFATHNKHIIYSIANIKYMTTQSHLWLEEYLNGDVKEFDKIHKYLEASRKELRVLQTGGKIRGMKYDANHNNPEIDNMMKDVTVQIDKIALMTKERLKSDKEYFAKLDEKFDTQFKVLTKSLNKLDIYVNKRFKFMYNSYEQLKVTLYTLIVIVGFITILLIRKLNNQVEEKIKVIDQKTEELKQINATLEKRVEDETQKNIQNEKELFQNKKIIQMNELLKNIGHHWRQPLSLISTTASSLRLNLELRDVSKEELMSSMDKISTSTENLSKTIDYFGSNITDRNELKEFGVDELVFKVSTIIDGLLQENDIVLVINSDTPNIKVKLYETKLLNVILSLISNAKDVLIDRQIENKQIKIYSYSDEINVYIEVSDNAGGVKANIIDRIFEPYFTTFHQSLNKGLSLYLNYESVKHDLGGELSVKNDEKGACFKIALPLVNS